MKYKYIGLREDVILVNGAKRGLIQNLKNKKIYSIDELSKRYLNRLLDGESIESILVIMEKAKHDSFIKYINILNENKLIYFSNNRTIRKDYLKNKDINNKINSVWLELRRACNLNCCHCYLDCSSNSDKNLNVLKLEEWISFINKLSKYKLERIILIGGEPLMFTGICALINYIRIKFPDIELILYSNLTLLNDNIIECIVKNKVKVITSIYSNISEIHDIITRKEGSFNLTVENIKKLKKLRVYVKANTTISKYNMNHIEDVAGFTYQLTGIRGKLDIVRDIGYSKANIIPNASGLKLSRVRTKAEFKGIDRRQFDKNHSGNSCWQGKINVTCDGKIGPCIMADNFINNVYNVRTHSLDKIINDYIIPEFWSMSKDYIEECRDCEYRYVCSDCRPICSEKGNIYSKGRVCTYNPYLGIWGKI